MKKREFINKLFIIAAFMIVNLMPAKSNAGSWNGWIYQDPYPTSVNLFDVKFVTPLKGWITGKYGTILYTEDGGENWEAQESGTEEDLMRVSFVNEKMGWAAGRSGTIIHTEDGGKKWVAQYNIKALPTKIFFINEKEGWIAGSNPIGALFRTQDSGKTWQKMEIGLQRAIGSVFFLNPLTGWIQAGEEIFRTKDGGSTWERSKLPIPEESMQRPLGRYPQGDALAKSPIGKGLGFDWFYGDIAFANEKQGWAVVNQWFIFHTDDGGQTWTTDLNTGYASYGLSHIAFRNAQNICVSGSTIYCTEDGGKTWRERLGVESGDSRSLGGVSLVGQSAGWVVGNNGQISKTEDSGKSWSDALRWNKCGGPARFFINNKTGWFYSPQKFNVLCKTDDGGQKWEKQTIGIKVKNVFFADKSTGWAVGLIEEWKDGKETSRPNDRVNVWGVIKHTKDGGKTWETQYKESMGKSNNPSLTKISFINPDTGWVIGTKGIILSTNDGGKHWEHQKSGDTKNSLMRFHFINSEVGWIVGTQFGDYWTGIVLHTEDGGKKWKIQNRRSDVGFRDVYFVDRKSGWVVGVTESGEAGVLVMTTDGGKTWSEKDIETIDFSSVTFLDKQRGIIFSSSGLALITIDGGKTWKKRRVPLRKYPWHFSEIFEKSQN